MNHHIEKDVRQIKNIENLNSFSNFLQFCAGRTGQIINLNSLAADAGISPNTAKSWLSILEANYIIFFLQPYFKNYNKRIIQFQNGPFVLNKFGGFLEIAYFYHEILNLYFIYS